jgi:hypothetical protein
MAAGGIESCPIQLPHTLEAAKGSAVERQANRVKPPNLERSILTMQGKPLALAFLLPTCLKLNLARRNAIKIYA